MDLITYLIIFLIIFLTFKLFLKITKIALKIILIIAVILLILSIFYQDELRSVFSAPSQEDNVSSPQENISSSNMTGSEDDNHSSYPEDT